MKNVYNLLSILIRQRHYIEHSNLNEWNVQRLIATQGSSHRTKQ